MKPERMTPLLNVERLDASIAFYEALGFEVADRVGDGKHGWCLMTCGDQRLMLSQSPRLDSTARRALGDYTDLVLYLYVDDAPAAWTELRARGLTGRHVGPQDYGLDEV